MNNIRQFVRLASNDKSVTRRFTVSKLFLLGMVICNLFIPQMIQTIDERVSPGKTWTSWSTPHCEWCCSPLSVPCCRS
jgi:hypothetical protein